MDVCVDGKCQHLALAEPTSCPLPDAKFGVCAWGECFAPSCAGMDDFTLCFATNHALGQGVCVGEVCQKQCEVNQGCNDGVACTVDWCENDPVNFGGFCMNDDSCSVGVCDAATGTCDD
ncbi:MAG: hypothetical protein EKK55_24530 [Rhodocyclaceae bacterium]|nr:MAG: hypothetical protein EKK55_24530 [Rhodocyclaceae bacterium]